MPARLAERDFGGSIEGLSARLDEFLTFEHPLGRVEVIHFHEGGGRLPQVGLGEGQEVCRPARVGLAS